MKLRITEFTGGRDSHETFSWPDDNNFIGRFNPENMRLTRLDWSIGKDYIESIRFTTATEVSPKFGVKAFTDYCHIEKPISRVTMTVKNRRLVGLAFHTRNEGVYLEILAGNSWNGTAEHVLMDWEKLVGFNVRIKDKSVTGLSLKIATQAD